MVLFRHGLGGADAWRGPGLHPNSESRYLWPGNKPTFRTRSRSQIFTSPTQRKNQPEKKKLINSHSRAGREKVGGNREIKIYADLRWIRWRGWIYFKVNVWQFRWNTVSLSNRRWKRTGKDERIKLQTAGRKRELLRYLSLGTHEKTLKILTNFEKWIAAHITLHASQPYTQTRDLKTWLSSSWLLHHRHQDLYS